MGAISASRARHDGGRIEYQTNGADDVASRTFIQSFADDLEAPIYAEELAATPDGGGVVALMDDLRIRRWSTHDGEPTNRHLLRPSGLHIQSAGRPHPSKEKTFVVSYDREDVMDAINAHMLTAAGAYVVLAGRGPEPSW